MKIACLVLAAGKSSRFGSPKQLADVGCNKKLIEAAVDKIPALFSDHTFVVLGAYRDEVKKKIPTCHIIENADWETGIGSSIACGVSYISNLNAYDGILIVLADQVAVTHGNMNELISEFSTGGTVCAFYRGKRGVPAIFPKEKFDTLMSLSGDVGAKKILNLSQENVIELKMVQAEIDIDTEQDLKAWKTSLK